MDPKELRQKILEITYEHRSDAMGAEVEHISESLPEASEQELHQEIDYLDQKGLLNIRGNYMGKEYLNFYAIKITGRGIDLVEDPESLNQLFSVNIDARHNHFSNITGSNIAIDSKYVSQLIDQEDSEMQELLTKLMAVTQEKNKSKMLEVLGYIGDKSIDLLIAIVAGGIKS